MDFFFSSLFVIVKFIILDNLLKVGWKLGIYNFCFCFLSIILRCLFCKFIFLILLFKLCVCLSSCDVESEESFILLFDLVVFFLVFGVNFLCFFKEVFSIF